MMTSMAVQREPPEMDENQLKSWLVIPPEMLEVSVWAMQMSTRARNALLFNRITRLGMLNGWSTANIGTLRNVGPLMADEIFNTISALTTTPPQTQATDSDPGADALATDAHSENWDHPVRETDSQAESRIDIPSEIRHWPVDVLWAQDTPVAKALMRRGLVTLGHLDGMTLRDLRTRSLSEWAAELVLEATRRLPTPVDLQVLVRRDADGALMPPRTPAGVWEALQRARSIEEELDALFVGLTERDSRLIRQAWTYQDGEKPTLAAVADDFGITRQRVDQIVGKRKALLNSTGVRLPLTSRVAEILDQNGGVASTAHLRQLLHQDGLDLSIRALELLPTIGAFGVAGATITYSLPHRLWLTEAGTREWLETGRLDEVAREIRIRAGKMLRRYGAISSSRLEVAKSFGAAQALALVGRKVIQVEKVLDFLVPIPVANCRLTRAVTQMLAVSPELSLRDIHSGLRRMQFMSPPPMEVVKAVLTYHHRFVVEGDLVRPVRDTFVRTSKDSLSHSDQVAIEIFERNGGVLLWWEFLDAVQAAGLSTAMASVLLRKPYIVRRATAVYALRGRRVSASQIREKSLERKNAGLSTLKQVKQVGADVVEVQYRLSRFALLGVLQLPSELRRVRVAHWRARLPDGSEMPVQARNGFLWSFARWFKQIGAKEGDIVVATFFVAEARVEFDEPFRGSKETTDVG